MNINRLNEFKKASGLTNAKIAEITGITQSNIDKITSGNNTNPKLETIQAICRAIGCTIDDLDDYISDNDFDNKIFLKKLEYQMNKKGIKNRSQLSKLSGIPYTTIVGFFEKGSENIRRTTLIKLSDFFECSIEYLVRDNVTDENYGKSTDFVISSSEIQHIKKYRTLDEHGTEMVDMVLDKEYDRCISIEEKEPTIEIAYSYIPASAGAGAFLDDENTELREYPDTPESRQADIVIPVDGDSMEPMFYDGDELYVRIQPDIEIGQIGIFIQGGRGYVKEKGVDRLISINPDYDDIYPNDYEEIKCIGKVIGKVERE